MSNTRMEIATAVDAYVHATGRVLVNGLGLGMVIEGILQKPDVSYVRVIEIDHSVIELVGYHLKRKYPGRLDIVHDNAFEYRPTADDRYDYAWHDVWDEISADNLVSIRKLTTKWRKPRAQKQGVWARDLIRRQEHRWNR